ncbi:hypothetical protein VNI00_000473 [Paramarasmius palmivorus]|uniref:Uncharacterized protein n=1 Tax=Paramarasmius palmivorus TaxID=297713 RepID=A0AAW0E5K4_9AGAR
MLKADTWVRYLSETESQRSLDNEVSIYAEQNSDHTTCIVYSSDDYTLERLADVKLDKDDKGLLRKEDRQCYGRHLQNSVSVPVPDDLRFDSVYWGLQAREVARIIDGIFNSWTVQNSDELFGRKITEDGLTRFAFDLKKPITGRLVPTHYSGEDVRRAWLTQAHYVINSGEDIEDLGKCFTASFIGQIHLETNGSSSITQRDSSSQLSCSGTALDDSVVYLFVSPPPTRISEVEDWVNSRIAFWSFEENGITQIPEDMRQCLGLPRLVLRRMNVKVMTWDQCVYDAMYTWQVARGFDPTTTDFARSLGLPIFEPVTPRESRIQEIIEEVEEPVESVGSQSETTIKDTEQAGLTSSNFAASPAYHERYVGVSLTLCFLLIFILIIGLSTPSLPLSRAS